jgi:hypothetical protein
MALQAFFDASSRSSGFYCVAGYAFSKLRLKKFEIEWRRLFARYGGCHMHELATRNGKFKGLGTEEQERLVRGAVEIINERMSYGVVISCLLPEMMALLPRWIRGFEHAYPVCCSLAMSGLGNLLRDRQRPETVDYHFERGDEYDGAAGAFMQRTFDVPLLKESYRHRSHQFVAKQTPGCQAADMLAWEWAKYIDETVAHKKRLMRLSLVSLMGKNGDFDSRYSGIHATGDSLANFCRQVTDLGLLQLEEDRV